jgi:hypothetical protein
MAGKRREGRQGLKRWVMLCAVPAIAVAVAARQVYLSKTEDLSTWKGGGMGMFAAADNTLGRFAKIYALLPTGQRMPLWQLTPKQQELLKRGLWFPSERTFSALAESIRTTIWYAGNEEIPLGLFDATGARVGVDDTVRLQEIRPAPVTPEGGRGNFAVEVQYWKATYDVKTGDLRAALARTFTFKD